MDNNTILVTASSQVVHIVQVSCAEIFWWIFLLMFSGNGQKSVSQDLKCIIVGKQRQVGPADKQLQSQKFPRLAYSKLQINFFRVTMWLTSLNVATCTRRHPGRTGSICCLTRKSEMLVFEMFSVNLRIQTKPITVGGISRSMMKLG